MRIILSILCLLISYMLAGQTVNDLSRAKRIALAENKLIILSFCNPCFRECTKIDQEIWNTQEFEKLYDRFVFVKVDVTQNNTLTDEYEVTLTPRIFIQTIKDDLIIDEQGPVVSLYFLDLLQSFPVGYEELNNASLALIDKDEVPPIKFYELGEAFRITGMKTNKRYIRNLLLSKSELYYKKTEKTSDSIELKQMSILSQLRIEAYQGRIQKVKKKLTKIEFKNESVKVKEMIAFIKAYCYKSEGDINEMLKVKERIKDTELLKELE